MKGEIKKAKEHASKAFDWDSISESRTFNERKNRRGLKKLAKELARVRMEVEEQQDGEPAPYEQSDIAGEYIRPKDCDNWKDDLGEYARRIWEWWLIRWLHVPDFTYFGTAIRKVVLWTLSSAIVERDFSQFLAIMNVCGNRLSFPAMQNRIFSRCNKRVYEELEAIIFADQSFKSAIEEDDEEGVISVGESDEE